MLFLSKHSGSDRRPARLLLDESAGDGGDCAICSLCNAAFVSESVEIVFVESLQESGTKRLILEASPSPRPAAARVDDTQTRSLSSF
ncbi:MAG: hypothetical protein HC923_05680 [Myxococcales bacterium]|nr:hypothetical protein [Myxococcales bacterium]